MPKARRLSAAGGVGAGIRSCALAAVVTLLGGASCSAQEPAPPARPSAVSAAPVSVAPAFVAIQVRDVDSMAEWYASVFALEEVRRIDADDGRYAIRILAGGGLVVELTHETRAAAPPARHHGLFKAGLYVREIESFRRALAERGVSVDEAVVFDAAVGARTFVFRDPEGNRLQAFEPCDDRCPPPQEEAPR